MKHFLRIVLLCATSLMMISHDILRIGSDACLSQVDSRRPCVTRSALQSKPEHSLRAERWEMNRDEMRWEMEAMWSYAEVLRLRASAKSVWGPWGASGDSHGQLGAPFPAGRALTRVRRFVASTWPVGSMTFALGPRGLSDDLSTS